MVVGAARQYGLSVVTLLGLLKAESGLNPDAIRRGAWPDCSAGLSQVTVATAGGYGIGNGEDTDENIQTVFAALCDRATAIDLGARILSGCLETVDEVMPGLSASDRELQGLIAYNSGSPQSHGNWYWERWHANIDNYLGCLEWAKSVIG
jgi:soluble lytic murein transglycosylase-like protein